MGLYILWMRGSDLPSTPSEDFSNLLQHAWTATIVDIFVVKLSYRPGT